MLEEQILNDMRVRLSGFDAALAIWMVEPLGQFSQKELDENNKVDLICAQCKLRTSLKNRRAQQRRLGPDQPHKKRIDHERKELARIERRLEQLDK